LVVVLFAAEKLYHLLSKYQSRASLLIGAYPAQGALVTFQ
jgi:hypothetical protein